MDWYNQYADMGVEFDKMPQKLQDAINALSIETAMMSENSVAIKDETSLLEAYGNETHTTVSNMDELKEAVERSGKSWDDVKKVRKIPGKRKRASMQPFPSIPVSNWLVIIESSFLRESGFKN